LGGILLLSFSSCEKATTREKYWKKIDLKRQKEEKFGSLPSAYDFPPSSKNFVPSS
jgi:hypothetical protein